MNINCEYTDLVTTDQLKHHPKNRNSHSADQVERLAKLLEYQGWRHPIVVSKLSGCIVAGHGRHLAAQELGLEKVPVDYQDFPDSDSEYAFIQSDNAIASWAELDLSGINDDLGDLGPDFDLDMLGLKDFTLDPSEKGGGGGDEDEAPEPPVEPKSKLGQVYKLGNHRLMCGDALKDVAELMEGNKADMLMTDPPYGYSYESNYQDKHQMLKNDDTFVDFFPGLNEVMANECTAYVFTSHQVIETWKALFVNYFDYKNMIVWKKNNWSMGDLKGAYAGQHELILFGTKGRPEMIGKRDTDVWSFDRDPPKNHPTQKPIDLLEFALSKFQSGKVLDLFGGSGSTLIACEKTNRTCYMMELEPKYIDVIIQRWEDYTGKKAELIKDV